jgi:glutaredoxin
MEMIHVDGINKGKVMLFGMSTCVYCNATKDFLKNLGVAYDYVYLDNIEDDKKYAEVYYELQKWNKTTAVPTIVINDKTVIVGFFENKIREALGE